MLVKIADFCEYMPKYLGVRPKDLNFYKLFIIIPMQVIWKSQFEKCHSITKLRNVIPEWVWKIVIVSLTCPFKEIFSIMLGCNFVYHVSKGFKIPKKVWSWNIPESNQNSLFCTWDCIKLTNLILINICHRQPFYFSCMNVDLWNLTVSIKTHLNKSSFGSCCQSLHICFYWNACVQ